MRAEGSYLQTRVRAEMGVFLGMARREVLNHQLGLGGFNATSLELRNTSHEIDIPETGSYFLPPRGNPGAPTIRLDNVNHPTPTSLLPSQEASESRSSLKEGENGIMSARESSATRGGCPIVPSHIGATCCRQPPLRAHH